MAKFAANSTTDVIKRAAASFDEETDPWLARQASVGQLKFVEGVLKATPHNTDLMIIIAKNYGLFAFAFLVYDLEGLEWGTPEYETLRARASDFFGRCKHYAIRALAEDYEDIADALNAKTDARLDQILEDADEEDHLPAFYWLAYAWGSQINLNTDDPAQVARLGRVKKIMTWVRTHDRTFENGGPVLFFGAVELALPPALGGKPDAARKAFEEGIAITGGKFLMGKALFAHYYHRAVNDRAGYERVLREVLDTPADIYPQQRLANELAKVRARRWLNDIDEHFDAPEGGEKSAAPAPTTEPEEDGDLD